jgi:hypothetical protein
MKQHMKIKDIYFLNKKDNIIYTVLFWTIFYNNGILEIHSISDFSGNFNCANLDWSSLYS